MESLHRFFIEISMLLTPTLHVTANFCKKVDALLVQIYTKSAYGTKFAHFARKLQKLQLNFAKIANYLPCSRYLRATPFTPRLFTPFFSASKRAQIRHASQVKIFSYFYLQS